MGRTKPQSINTRTDSKVRRELFCQAYTVSFNATKAAGEAGFAAPNVKGSNLLKEPGVQARIAEIIKERCAKIQDAEFPVLGKVREVVDRCMQAVPVKDRLGNPVEGEWRFNAGAALKGLELLGRHEGLFATKFDVTLNEQKASEAIKRALTIVAKHVTPEVFRAIVADLEGAGDA